MTHHLLLTLLCHTAMIILCSTELWCYSRLLSLFLTPRHERPAVRLILCLLFSLWPALVSPMLPSELRLIIMLAFWPLFGVVTHCGRLRSHLLAFALLTVIANAAEAACAFVFMQLGWDPKAFTQLQLTIFNAVYVLLSCIAMQLLTRSISPGRERLDGRTWLILGAASLLSCATSVILLFNSVDSISSGSFRFSAWLPLIDMLSAPIPLLALLALLAMFDRMNRTILARHEAELSEYLAREALRRSEASRLKDEQLRTLRHDFRNHLAAIRALNDHGDSVRLHDYLLSLSDTLESTAMPVYCGHRLIDSLVESALLRAKRSGITVETALKPIDPDLPVADMTLCCLLGNLLDNAVDAAAASEEKRLRISAAGTPDAFTLCIENSCADPAESLRHLSRTHASRGSEHGLGHLSARHAAEQAGGTLQYTATDDTIVASVYLPLRSAQ